MFPTPITATLTLSLFMVSEGTYEQNFFGLYIGANEIRWQIPLTEDEGETIAAYAQRTGLIPGDIYTIVAIVRGNNIVHNGVDMSGQLSEAVGTKQFNSVFAFIRAQVKADVLTNTAAKADNKVTDIFDVTLENNPDIPVGDGTFVKAIASPFDASAVSADSILNSFGSAAIIRSRLDQDLRSTSYMLVQNNEGYGITSPYILPTWKKGTDALGTSELILESDQTFVRA